MHGADADAVQESGRLLSACVGFLRAWRRRPTFGWFMDFWGVISSNAMATSGPTLSDLVILVVFSGA